MSRAIRAPAVEGPTEPTSATDRTRPDALRQHGELLSIRRKLRNCSLSLVLLGLFLAFLVAQSITGFHYYNQQQQEHAQPAIPYLQYLTTGHFLEAVGENWESEFLQMGMFVFLTVFLFQKGSPESNDPDKREPERKPDANSPWPVRRGGWMEALYNYSLSIAFLLLFLGAFLIHLFAGAKDYQEDQLAHGQAPSTLLEYARTSRFWFESFQNWQSEFLAIFALVVLAIWLRQKGSPESKDPATPHWENE